MRSKAKASSSCISPSRLARERARDAIGGDRFVEVCVKAAAESCATRDPKGLYQRAHSGDLPAFAGVSAPYEAPTTPTLIVDTEQLALPEATQRLTGCVIDKFGDQPARSIPREAS